MPSLRSLCHHLNAPVVAPHGELRARARHLPVEQRATVEDFWEGDSAFGGFCDSVLLVEDFEVWYAGAHARLLGSLFLLCGDVDYAREVVDEACARAFERWSRVGRMESPTGWTYVVALRELRHRQRRRRRERDLSRVAVEPEVPGIAVELWTLLDGLPPRQRTAVVLRHVADLTEADVATAMSVTRSTVSNTLRDAYRNLRETLEPSAEEKPDACTP